MFKISEEMIKSFTLMQFALLGIAQATQGDNNPELKKIHNIAMGGLSLSDEDDNEDEDEQEEDAENAKAAPIAKPAKKKPGRKPGRKPGQKLMAKIEVSAKKKPGPKPKSLANGAEAHAHA